MTGARWFLLLTGVAVIAVAGLFGRHLGWWAFGVLLGINVLDLVVAWAGPTLHALRTRGKPPEPVDLQEGSQTQVAIPDTVKQRSKDVKRRLGGTTLAATDRRTLMDEERRRRL